MENQLNIPDVTQQVVELDDRLLVLRFNLGKLRVALEQAFAPVAVNILPVVDEAVRGLTGLVKQAGWLMAALFGQVRTESATTTKKVSGSVKRALAGFDKLERLSLGGGGSYTVETPKALQEIPQKFKDMADRIRAFLKPLQDIDFSAACAALGRLKEAIAPFTRMALDGLNWLWQEILVPMAQWGAEQALPAFLDLLSAGLDFLRETIVAAQPLLSWLWNELLKPIAAWAGERLIGNLHNLTGVLQTLSGWMEGARPITEALAEKLSYLKQAFSNAAGGMGLFRDQHGALSSALQGLSRGLETVGNTVSNLGGKIKEVFTGISPMLRSVANTAIGLVNMAISGVEASINAMVRALNGLSFDIPNWVPGLGGKRFGLSLKTVDLPSVPYLAQGAVLPPNKPFLAVVGDQRSGTNVEAPLATIQQAVAEVMGQGSADTNRLLAQILTAIGAIEVGDETIGRAARRFESRMALMGGML